MLTGTFFELFTAKSERAKFKREALFPPTVPAQSLIVSVTHLHQHHEPRSAMLKIATVADSLITVNQQN